MFFVILIFLAGLALIFFAPGIRKFNYKYHQRNLKRFGLLGTVWDRFPGPWAFRLLGLAWIVILFIGVLYGPKRRDCSLIGQLNLDIPCRITDNRDGKELVEYFDIDNNELKLYIRQNGHDRLIEHPNGRVKIYHDKVDDNAIKFNPADENTLLVNGEVFPIAQNQ